MNLSDRIELLSSLGDWISEFDPELTRAMEKAEIENPWFTNENTRKSLLSISQFFLQIDLLREWVESHRVVDPVCKKNIGLIMAGNIPLVGFHDFLCCFAGGHRANIKLSDNDVVLWPVLFDKLLEMNPAVSDYFKVTDRLNQIDAVIATGSNNSAVYFEYYFGKFPHIIRRNRNSVAVMDGNESEKDVMGLLSDIFTYFGLGCRNVSKIFIPEEYPLTHLLDMSEAYRDLILHNKYKNNYDYNHAVFLLNKENFLTNGWVIFRENTHLASRISSVHYEYYSDPIDLRTNLLENRNQIQCMVSNVEMEGVDIIPFGSTQNVHLNQFADGVDTMQFLKSLIDSEN